MPSLRHSEDYSRSLSDLSGRTFNFLTVIRRADIVGKKVKWECKCVCGKISIVRGDGLKSGTTKSCGCKHDERMRSGLGRTHGLSGGRSERHPIYRKWEAMKARCYNESSVCYPFYGAKGIRVDEPWLSDFAEFFKDMAPTWEPGLTIERNDPRLNYNRNNCCWIPQGEQCENTTRTVFARFNGKTQSIIKWADELGISLRSAHHKLAHLRVERP